MATELFPEEIVFEPMETACAPDDVALVPMAML
jgi:hypothetical protein